MYMLLGVALLFFLIWLVWGNDLRTMLLPLRSLLLLPAASVSSSAAEARDLVLLKAMDDAGTDWGVFYSALLSTSLLALLPFVLPIVYTIIAVYRRRTFVKQHDMQSLLEQEKSLWPTVAPVAGLDLIAGDIRVGAWRVSLDEREFAKEHQLLLPSTQKDSMGNPITELNRKKAREVFAQQLGPLWRNQFDLPPFARGIYLALAVRVAATELKNDKEFFEQVAKSQSYMDQMAASFAKTNSIKSIDASWFKEAEKAIEGSRLLLAIESQHAYTYTLLASLLATARTLTGVVAAADFLWLRPTDRTLWYALNSVGRQDAYFVESAGVMCHWAHERSTRGAMLKPQVEQAIEGLAEALLNFKDEDDLAVISD